MVPFSPPKGRLRRSYGGSMKAEGERGIALRGSGLRLVLTIETTVICRPEQMIAGGMIFPGVPYLSELEVKLLIRIRG